MKPFIEKLPLGEDRSFVAQTHRTPDFEVPWHQHIEYELILFTEGAGLSFIGNYVGEFEKGDIFFLGSNVPHTFQKSIAESITSAVVVHFKENFWGEEILSLPESKPIKRLLQRSMHGIKISGRAKEILQPLIKSLETEKGFWRITKLCECLSILSETKEYITVSTQEIKALNPRDKDRIDSVFQYTMDNFREPIQLLLISKKSRYEYPGILHLF